MNMTMTVKLDPPLERALRSRSAALGISASAVMREALQAYLSQTEPSQPSAYELGASVFGKYAGPVDLASRRKEHLGDVLVEKQLSRAVPAKQPRHGKAPRA
jgi:plasmid stability protein